MPCYLALTAVPSSCSAGYTSSVVAEREDRGAQTSQIRAISNVHLPARAADQHHYSPWLLSALPQPWLPFRFAGPAPACCSHWPSCRNAALAPDFNQHKRTGQP